jgi:hypothetical protein
LSIPRVLSIERWMEEDRQVVVHTLLHLLRPQSLHLASVLLHTVSWFCLPCFC